MDKKWERRKIPDIGDLLTVRKTNKQVHDFIIGHLMVETILVQLIDTKLKHPEKFDSFKLSFPQKVDLCSALWLLKDEGVDFLKLINQERNKFAHNLNYQLTFNEVFSLVQKLGEMIEFVNGVDRDEEFAKKCYDEGSLIEMLFDRLCENLSDVVYKNGGKYNFKSIFQ